MADGATVARPFVDVAAVLAGGLPEPPAPVLLTREDGHALFYSGQVNVLFGDPESGKTWVAYAAVQEALRDRGRALVVDLDHNGAPQILSRLLALGVEAGVLSDPDRFRLAEPEDAAEMLLAVVAGAEWRPAVAVVDSVGEMVAMFGANSNDPDEWSVLNRRTLQALANVGAVVIAVDHLPKSTDARVHGQTGTLAKRRSIGGVSLRVEAREPFAPGLGGCSALTIAKDRPGGLRAHCPAIGHHQPAGLFVLEQVGDLTIWRITNPTVAQFADPAPSVSDSDLADLDALDPPPRSQRDVKDRLGWGSHRALTGLTEWRKRVAS